MLSLTLVLASLSEVIAAPHSSTNSTETNRTYRWMTNNYWDRRFTKYHDLSVFRSSVVCLYLRKANCLSLLLTIVNFLINFLSLFIPSIFYVGFYHPLVFVGKSRISAGINIILIYKRFSVRRAIAFFNFPYTFDYMYRYILTRLKFLINTGLVK